MEKRPDSLSALGLSSEDAARIAALYNGRYAELGYNIRTVGWGSALDQKLRFEMLARGLMLKGARILDIGCGLGDLAGWLTSLYPSDFEYLGLDLAGDLVSAAREKHGSASVRFEEGSLTKAGKFGTFDFAFLSGTLTFRTSNNRETMQKLLRLAYESTTQAVASNFMSTYADSQLEKNVHFDPADVFRFAKELSPRANLYHDYPLYEFTIQILHPAKSK